MELNLLCAASYISIATEHDSYNREMIFWQETQLYINRTVTIITNYLSGDMQEELRLHVKQGVMQKFSNVSPKQPCTQLGHRIPSSFINTWAQVHYDQISNQ